MPASDFEIKKRRAADDAAILALSARAFGPGRFARSAYRVRELSQSGSAPNEFDYCAWRDKQLVGAIHFSKVTIGGEPGALLLGPLVIDPGYVGRGCGQQLIEKALTAAEASDQLVVVLVGDLSYYGKFGFHANSPGKMTLPGPVDPARLLLRELVPDAADRFAGEIRPAQC